MFWTGAAEDATSYPAAETGAPFPLSSKFVSLRKLKGLGPSLGVLGPCAAFEGLGQVFVSCGSFSDSLI